MYFIFHEIYLIIIHYMLILLLDNYWRELCMWNMLKKKGKVCENSYAISCVIIRDLKPHLYKCLKLCIKGKCKYLYMFKCK